MPNNSRNDKINVSSYPNYYNWPGVKKLTVILCSRYTHDQGCESGVIMLDTY